MVPGKSGPHEMARGSSSLLSSHGRVIGPQDDECSLEGLMLKLKLQYFVHLTRRTDSLEKTLMLGKTEGGRNGDDRG